MFDKKSLFALNKKNSNAIVYTNASGKPILLTQDQFSGEEEFLYWKALSDADFHNEEIKTHLEANHTTSTETLNESALRIPAIDVMLAEMETQIDCVQAAHLQIREIQEILTEKQFERLWLYYVHEMKLESIAEKEGVSHQNISKSINAAKKKIIKFYAKLENRVQNDA